MSFRGKGILNEIPMVGMGTPVKMLWCSFASIWSCAIVYVCQYKTPLKGIWNIKIKPINLRARNILSQGKKMWRNSRTDLGTLPGGLALVAPLRKGGTIPYVSASWHRHILKNIIALMGKILCLEYWTTLAKTNTIPDWMFSLFFNNFHSLERKFLWFVFFPPRKEHFNETCMGCGQCS